MTTAQVLAQHIATLNPDKDAARLSLHNYLSFFCNASDDVNAELINRFYRKALTFKHWQENKPALFAETEALLAHFQETSGERLHLDGLMRAGDFQIIEVENLRDLEIITRNYLETNLKPGERVRVLRDGDARIIAITLGLERSLTVTTYPRAIMLSEGKMKPLDAEDTLCYDSGLQLRQGHRHQITIGPFSSASFIVGSKGLRGVMVRGYTFQQSGIIDGGGLTRYPLLFYPIKRLEQFFVDRKTDPMYIDLMQALRTASNALTPQSSPEDWRIARAAFERGRLALDHIFPDDNYARLLINNLEKQLAFEQQVLSQPPAAQPAPELVKDEPWPEIKNLPV